MFGDLDNGYWSCYLVVELDKYNTIFTLVYLFQPTQLSDTVTVCNRE